MSDCMDVLLQDQRRIEDRRVPPAPPVTRAERIIAAGHAKRTAYRHMHTDADTAMVYGAQMGYLHGEIQQLCAELQAFKFERNTHLLYATLPCHALDCDVLVGYEYSPGEPARTYGPPERCHDGSPEELNVCEVVLNGADIVGALSESVMDQLADAALQVEHDKQEADRAGDER